MENKFIVGIVIAVVLIVGAIGMTVYQKTHQQNNQNNYQNPATATITLNSLTTSQYLGGFNPYAPQSLSTLTPEQNAQNLKLFQRGVPGTLGQWMGYKGDIFYGASWCPHCNNMKLLFGEDMKNVPYVECSLDGNPQSGQLKVCADAGVTGYPTWKIDGKLSSGEMSLEQLAQLTGYPQK